MIEINIKPGEVVDLPVVGDAPRQVHVFEEPSIYAIKAAVAAKRPLLVRGEPGTGKTQLARAAAKALGWAFVPKAIDARSEASDLMYEMDAITRLGEAQITGVLNIKEESVLREKLAQKRFIKPGPLWWAFDWASAKEQSELVGDHLPDLQDQGNPYEGCVLLIDEIDKADSDLPNGLLTAFGSGYFQVPGIEKPIRRSKKPLLAIITTNEERALPDAFLRRCLVHHLEFPKGDKIIEFFVDRGRAHFSAQKVSQGVLQKAAEQVKTDREHLLALNLAAPGLAEYLDLIRALINMERTAEKQLSLLSEIQGFVLKKHPEV